MIKRQENFSTDNVQELGKLGVILGNAGVGEKKDPAYLKNFSKDQRHYMQHLQHLHDNTGLGFSSRNSKGYGQIADYFFKNQGKKGFFAVNAGNPAGGQTAALIDMPLTDVSNGYFNQAFIADQVLTDSPVMMRTGHIGRYGQDHNVYNNPDTIRAEGSANVQQTFPVSRDFLNYNVGTFALKDSLSPDDYMNVMRPFNAEEDLTIALKQILMLSREIQLSDMLFTTANYPNSSVIDLSTENDRFDKPASSSIDEQVLKLRDSIRNQCGMNPNTAIIDEAVFEAMSRHPQARGTIFKDVSMNRTASEEEVRKLLQVERLLIGRVARADDVSPDSALQRVWTKNLWMGYVAPTKALRQKTFGYYHHFRTSDSFIIARQSVGNPVNKEVFCYLSWQHHPVDYKCGGVITNAIS